MKSKNYILIGLFFYATIVLHAQQGVTIQGGGAVTVNGNLIITPTSWSCGQSITDARDGKTYTTVQIGTQCWMAQNLNFGIRIDGATGQNDNNVPEKHCFNNIEVNCDIYGGLYQWNEVVQYSNTAPIQGLCLNGWHLPSDAEWTILINYLGGQSVAGGKMKEVGFIHWLAPNIGSSNSSGFTALAGGWSYGGSFSHLNYFAFIWSSSDLGGTHAYYRYLDYSTEAVGRYLNDKGGGFNARCLKD